ncbi:MULTISPECIES: hypothetical protein [unclassified Moorena]|uniref:hypothetical protein n=1 Tax=unclassified Moorena TaxID=2683338 RepID=UPI0025EE65FE|nr:MULTISPECIES: hypothetical protein [unclassified Moorena]
MQKYFYDSVYVNSCPLFPVPCSLFPTSAAKSNEQELERWMNSITETTEGSDIVVDEKTGVFGHKVSMLDFDPKDLGRFRTIGKIVEFDYVPGVVETALALSGSAGLNQGLSMNQLITSNFQLPIMDTGVIGSEVRL